MSTTPLTDFLWARIMEDEAVAREADAGGFGEWETYTTGAWATGVKRVRDATIICESKSRPSGSKAHIARHDPARVLAECEAKRRIVRAHSGRGVPTKAEWYDERHLCYDSMTHEDECYELHALAEVYADHPDYRQEWAAYFQADL